jgi:hypothetical protein
MAWMESQLRGDDPAVKQRVRQFFQFMDMEEASGTIDFHIKPGADSMHSLCEVHVPRHATT